MNAFNIVNIYSGLNASPEWERRSQNALNAKMNGEKKKNAIEEFEILEHQKITKYHPSGGYISTNEANMLTNIKEHELVKLNYEEALRECRSVIERYNSLDSRELNKSFSRDQIAKVQAGCTVQDMDIQHLYANIRVFGGLPVARNNMPLGPYITLHDPLKHLKDMRNALVHNKHIETYEKSKFDLKLDDLQTYCTEILDELKNHCLRPDSISLIDNMISEITKSFLLMKKPLNFPMKQKTKEVMSKIPQILFNRDVFGITSEESVNASKLIVQAAKETSTVPAEQTVEQDDLAERMKGVEDKVEAIEKNSNVTAIMGEMDSYIPRKERFNTFRYMHAVQLLSQKTLLFALWSLSPGFDCQRFIEILMNAVSTGGTKNSFTDAECKRIIEGKTSTFDTPLLYKVLQITFGLQPTQDDCWYYQEIKLLHSLLYRMKDLRNISSHKEFQLINSPRQLDAYLDKHVKNADGEMLAMKKGCKEITEVCMHWVEEDPGSSIDDRNYISDFLYQDNGENITQKNLCDTIDINQQGKRDASVVHPVIHMVIEKMAENKYSSKPVGFPANHHVWLYLQADVGNEMDFSSDMKNNIKGNTGRLPKQLNVTKLENFHNQRKNVGFSENKEKQYLGMNKQEFKICRGPIEKRG